MKKYLTTILAVMLTMTMTAQREKWTVKDKGPSLSNYFTPATDTPANVDGEGFIRRWTLLEPIDKPNRGNTVFTDSYLRDNLAV